MNPALIENPTRMMGRPQNVPDDLCGTLAIRDIPHKVLGNQMWSKWTPTAEEVELLTQGSSVYLIISGVSHPMVSLAVGTHIEGDEA